MHKEDPQKVLHLSALILKENFSLQDVRTGAAINYDGEYTWRVGIKMWVKVKGVQLCFL